MGLQAVTFTGADDGIDPWALVQLSRDYPFVEWGILVSAKRAGVPRFPSREWRDRFASVALENHLRCSLHLCGSEYVTPMLLGTPTFLATSAARWLLDACERVQINTHGEAQVWRADEMAKVIASWGAREVIQQIDGCDGRVILETVYAEGVRNIVPLFDLSHGAGVLPPTWPLAPYRDEAAEKRKCGYAGGLGPDNLAAQLPLIEAAAAGAPFWVDMETQVRSDGRFDLDKVRRCLEIAAEFRKAAR